MSFAGGLRAEWMPVSRTLPWILALFLCVIADGLSADAPPSLPRVEWASSPDLVSADGYATLAWRTDDGSRGGLYLLTETRGNDQQASYVEGEQLRVFRGEPGSYGFYLQFCRKPLDAPPDCGKRSRRATLTVADSVRVESADAAEARQRARSGGTAPEPVRDGPAQLRPGLWYNPDRNGHGWSFYWANRLALPESDSLHGNVFDLVGTWYTYEAKTRFLDGPPPCGEGGYGDECYWVYENYRPLAARLRLVRTGTASYQGAVYIRRNGEEWQVGSAVVSFAADNQAATIDWSVDFRWQRLAASDPVILLAGTDPAQPQGPGHYSGIWRLPGDDRYEIVEDIGTYSEAVEILFTDTAGDTGWLQASNAWGPQASDTPLCFYYVLQGYAPDETGHPGLYESGCSASSSASATNRNGRRYFESFERMRLWAQFDIPASTSGEQLRIGSSSYPATLEKIVGLHRIQFSLSGDSCELSESTPVCTPRLTWFTAGDYPQASVYALHVESGQREWLATPGIPAVTDYPVSLDVPGTWRFELRVGASEQSTLIAETGVLAVTEAAPSAPAAPSALQAAWTDQAGRAFRVSWGHAEPASVDRYELEETPPIGSGTMHTVQPGSVMHRDFQKLAGPHGDYAYRVRACRGAACSAWGPSLPWHVPAPGGGGSGETVHPWQDHSAGTGSLVTDVSYHYAMGYHFRPSVDGQVTELGGLFSGSKWVRLFERSSGRLLAEARVTADNDWRYAAIEPVSVAAGAEYTVAVYLAGSGGSYRTAPGFPVAASDVTILASTYIRTVSDPAAVPVNSTTSRMYGQADIGFAPAVAAPNQPPELTPPPGQVNDIGDSVDLQVQVSDPDGDAVTCAFSGLPPGLAAAGACAVSGRIESPAGQYQVTVVASDGQAQSDPAIFSWEVRSPGVPATPEIPPSPAPRPDFSVNPDAVGVGLAPGEFRVDARGGANYRIPILVAPGAGGFAPSISLDYNSQAPNDIAGVGWSVGGLSAITRCPQTAEQDGLAANRPVDLTAGDRFCLDGQRLMAVNGAHGADGTEYRKELDDFTRIVSHGGGSAGPAYFVAWHGDGSFSEYGRSEDSRVEARGGPVAGAVLAWARNRDQDSSGNFIDYQYLEAATGPVEIVVDRIRYTGNTRAGTSPFAELRFFYADDRDDVAPAFIRGVETGRSRLLQRIESWAKAGGASANWQSLRSYFLDYGQDGHGRAALESVQECSDAGRVYCFEPTRFGWLKSEHGVAAGGLGVGDLFDRQFRGLGIADVDGDARPDLLIADRQKQGKGFTFRIAWSSADGSFRADDASYSIPDRGDGESPVGLLAADLDGDGFQDVLYPRELTGTVTWVARMSNGSGFAAETVVAGDCCGQLVPPVARIMDFNGDGRPDLLTTRATDQLPGRGELVVLINGGSGNGAPRFDSVRPLAVDYDPALFPAGPTTDGWLRNDDAPEFLDIVAHSAVGAMPADFDGDGRVDLLARIGRHYERCQGDCTIQRDAPASSEFDIEAAGSGGAGSFQPDGVARAEASFYIVFEAADGDRYVQKEIVAVGAELDCSVPDACRAWSHLPAAMQMVPVDINGDGLSDLAFRDGDHAWHFRLNSGAGFSEPGVLTPPLDEAASRTAQFIDLTGDGYPEFMHADVAATDRARWQVYTNALGSAFAAADATGLRAGDRLEGDASILLDFNGDGMLDHLAIDLENGRVSGGETRLALGRNLITAGAAEPNNVINTITASTGAVTRVYYGPLTDPQVHTPLRGAPATAWGRGGAVFDLLAPVYVVSSVARSAPTFEDPAAMRSEAFHYAGGKIQAGGRGFLGFAEVVSWDPQRGLRSNTRYRLDFPYSGSVAESALALVGPAQRFDLLRTALTGLSGPVDESTQPPAIAGSARLLEYTVNQWSARETAPVRGAWSREPVRTLYRRYTPAGTLERKELTRRQYDAYGRETQSLLTTWASDSGPEFSTLITDNSYLAPEVSRWQLSRLAESRVSHARPGQPDVVRTSRFGYAAASGLLTSETVEPGDAALQAETTHDLDLFGNRISTTVRGIGMDARTSSVSYNPAGRVAVASRNHYGQTVRQVMQWDAFGMALREADIEGTVTETAVDPLGRVFGSWSETGAWERSRLQHGRGAHCPAGTAYHEMREAGGRPGVQTCFDVLGRELRSATTGFDGTPIYRDSYYDLNGRVARVSEPYYAGDARHWTTTTYDELGRVVELDAPGADVLYTDYGEHAGISCGIQEPGTVRTTNALGQERIEVFNPAGEIVASYDASCGSTEFEYDAFGNLIRVTGVDGAVIEMQYDRAGRKTAMQDPDKGHWRYAWNALGELLRQLDAKGQAIDYAYDGLGRVTQKTELENVSSLGDQQVTVVNLESTTWNNATTQTSRGKGQVSTASYSSGTNGIILHRKQIEYDRFGRVVSEISEQGGMQFARGWTYDQFGRTFQEFDASGDYRGVKHGYTGTGYPLRWQEAREGLQGQVYHEIHALDARGNVLHATLGNGVETFARYDDATGQLLGLEAYDRHGIELQQVDYLFDALGNLLERHDRSNGRDVLEDFSYDQANRLVRVDRTAPAEGLYSPAQSMALSYDMSGNIAWKSDVGTYLYGEQGAGRHAVTRAGGQSYRYDANGNQVSGAGRTIVYNVSDKPLLITRNGGQSEFVYGVGQQRIRRDDANAVDGQKTTHYVGSVEYVEQGSASWFRRYLAGVAIAEFYPAQTSQQVLFLVKDHLGSPQVLTDDSGEISGATWLSFDAFGQRRESNSDGLLGLDGLAGVNALTSRGFTGHEHVDAMDVIHMGGRIYDPTLGRFLQADPYLAERASGEALNRYSYALNNPLSYTDPSGFFLKRFVKRWGRLIVALALSVVLPGSQGILATYFGVGNIFAQAAITGFVSGAIAAGTLQGAVIGSLTALAVTGIVQAFSTGKPGPGLADTSTLALTDVDVKHLYGADGPPAGLYRITVDSEGALLFQHPISEAAIGTGEIIFTNGMNNGFSSAIRNATTHLFQSGSLGSSYVLNFNPTQGFFTDLLEAATDVVGAHTGWAHSELARNLAGTLQALSERGVTGIQLVGHSQGGAIAASALRYAGASGLNLSALSGGGLTLHGAPVNAWLARSRIAGPGGFGLVSRAQFGDAVHVLGGLNISNPLELPVALLRFPALFSRDAGLSPHTLPCGSRSMVCAP